MFSSSEGLRHRAFEYGIAPLLCALAAAASWALTPPVQVSLLAFYAAVAAAGWHGGLGAAVLATGLSAIAVASLLLTPVASWRVEAPADIVVLAVFVLSGLALGVMLNAFRQRQRRDRADRLLAEQTRRQAEHLLAVTTALSRAQTPADVIEACVLEVCHSLTAAAAAMVQVDEEGRSGDLVRAVGFPEASLDGWRSVSLQPETLLGDAVRARAMIVLESYAARRAAYGDLADAQFVAQYEATAVVPLIARGRVIAVLALARSDPGWSAEEREFLQQVSVRAAPALDRARQYELAERARAEAEHLRARADQDLAERQRAQAALRDSEARYRALAVRTSRLHGLTAALSEAVTVEAVAHAVVRHGTLVVGAQGGSMTLLVEDGARFQTLAADGSPESGEPGGQFAVEPGLCLTEAVQTCRPVFVSSFAEWQERYGLSALRAADGGYASTSVLPLVAEGVAIGVLEFSFTAPVSFDDDHRALLTSVAQHCVQALDRARLYDAEHRARSEAETANRLKDNFLSTVSHELRTPLNAILGWSAMLRLGTLDEERTGRAIKAIHDNAARQARLVDELLDLSRIAAGRVSLDLQELDLGATILGAVESILPVAEANGVEVRLGPPLPVRVVADASRLQQVFLNLLSNAVKFTPAGGWIEVRVASTDRAVEVDVSDTGIGIDAEFLPCVFDRFRQADSHTTRAHGGLGLGLSIARYLVQAHGGSIRVQSAGRNRGSTFTVTLPVVAAARDAGPVEAADRGDAGDLPALHGVRVLVVDDEPDARDMMACVLTSCGAAVTTAASAREALDALARTAVDVLLADIGMPDEDGYSLIRKVRLLPWAGRATVPAAAVTAFAGDDQRQRALAAGFQLHVAKPVDASRLARAVLTLCESRTSAS